jgi:hypothetical protein
MVKRPKKSGGTRVKVISNKPPEPALPFVQHAFDNKIECLFERPRAVLISREAYARMWHFVDIAEDEVGWLGTVERLQNGGFMIEEVFLLQQEVSSAQTEISEEGVALLAEELFTRPDGLELVNKLRFWGHSHVMMGTSPSFQDDKQMDLFRDNGCEWFIRAILNKRGRMEIDIYFFESGVMFKDVPWIIYQPVDQEMREEIRAEFSEKVTKRVYTPMHVGGNGNLMEDWRNSEFFPGSAHSQFGGAEYVSEEGDGALLEEVRQDLKERRVTIQTLDIESLPSALCKSMRKRREGGE